MAGPSASFDGDSDAVMFDDNNDDFQLPDNFVYMVNVAADGVLSHQAWSISANSTIDTVSPSTK